MLPTIEPTFAANVLQTVLPIAIFLISIIAWLVNLVNEKNRQNPRGEAPKPRPRPNDDRFQNEIDMFLNEVQGKKPNPREEEVAIEIVHDDDDERQMDGLQRGGLGNLPGRSLRDRHLQSSVASDVEQHMHADNVGERTETPLGGELGSLPSRSAPKRTSTRQAASKASNVVKWLQNPNDVRKAIIVSEVLAPCRSLPPRK